MKNLNLILLFLFLSLSLFSCHSKPEIKEQEQRQTRNEYTIQNYKLDDDELANKKTEATKINNSIKEKKIAKLQKSNH